MFKVGTGKLSYELDEGWGKLPEGWTFTQVAGVAVDQQDRVYVFNRSPHPVIILDQQGDFLSSWGEGIFTRPHGILIDRNNEVLCVDDADHTVRKFTLDGKLLMTLGTKNKPGENGAPFNRPTNPAVSPRGDIYISDGYGNSRVHRFSAEGKLILSWGTPGSDPGQFNIPHGVWIDKNERVYVADRQNNRIQIFTNKGEYLTQWTGFQQPCAVFMDKEENVFVPELRSRMSILNMNGEVLLRWGGEKSKDLGLFTAPHCACLDSHRDLYIGEVLEGQRIQKFIRKG